MSTDNKWISVFVPIRSIFTNPVTFDRKILMDNTVNNLQLLLHKHKIVDIVNDKFGENA